jgi:hypothetical protein
MHGEREKAGGGTRPWRAWGVLSLLIFVFALGPASAQGTGAVYLRPNAEVATSNPWTVVGAAKAWEALDDPVDPTKAPTGTDAITTSSYYSRVTDVGIGTTSLSGLAMRGATAWFYSGTAAPVEFQVREGSTILGSGKFSSLGWHSVNVPLNGSQTQLDAATLRFISSDATSKAVYASFLKLETLPAPILNTVRLRTNIDVPSSTPWTVVGAGTAWQALDDNVTELESPSTADRITTTLYAALTEVGLETMPLSGMTIKGASAWVYTGANAVAVEVRNGAEVLASQTISGAGWHGIAVPMKGTQSQLDSFSLRFKWGNSGTPEVAAAFFRLRLEPPPERIYWGSWIDGEPYGDPDDAPWDESVWDTFVSHAGEKDVSVVHFGQPPPWNHLKFEPGPLNLAWSRNVIPLMDMGSEKDKELGGDVKLDDIVNGTPDVIEDLQRWAKEAKGYGYPFFFRWDWEMNGDWFQWGEEAERNPSLYVAAWRRFHDIAEEAGATNITWVWCPNITGPSSPPAQNLYPGDGYVDWTCLDGYNWGGTQWISFYSLFNQSYRELLALAPNKPIMIGETAAAEVGGSKAAWITDAIGTQVPQWLPRIRAFLWFNWNHLGREWPIETSTSAREAFAAAIASPYYASNEFSWPTPMEKIEPLP